MKTRIVSVVTSLVAAMALLLPQSVAADCRAVMHTMYRGYGAPGSFKVAAGANFGLGDSNDQTVVSADGSYAFAEKFALRVGLGRCSTGTLGELTYGVQGLSDLWASQDGKTKLQGTFGFNYVDLNGSTTTVLPLRMNVRHAIAPTVDVWGGGEYAVNRFSTGDFSSSQGNFGLQAGVTADVNDTVSFRTGISSQFWEGNTVYGLSTSLSYKVPQSN